MSENKKADPKAIQALKEIYDSLTDEQKAKAKKCKTTEELLKLAGEEGIELPDEALDAAAGGNCKTTDDFLKLAGEEGIKHPDETPDSVAGGALPIDPKTGKLLTTGKC